MLRITYTQIHIDQTSESSLYRLCCIKGESILYLISEYSKLTQSQDKEGMTALHKTLSGNYVVCMALKKKVDGMTIYHRVSENEETKILGGFTIQCDRYVQNRRLDIVVVEKSKQECKIIDLAVLNDDRVGSKERERIEKYQDLRQEGAYIWRLKKVQLIPIMIGALGMISKKVEMWLGKIAVNIRTETLQKSTLLGTARILRKALGM